METAFVLGNGPSLRAIDLAQLAGVPTIGMNAAYRHWQRIGWYPTHYCCVDDALVATHHEAIASLIHEGRVRTALVTARLLEFHPALAEDPRCHVFERFHRPSFETHGRRLGLSFEGHEAFRASQPWKVTTGAYAVRYAIYLGYRTLYLLGVDCRYVEAPLEIRPVGGLTLELTRTPDTNPNYFFDDYQQAGDRFQVPNPPIYGDNLHLQSLELVRDDVERLRLPVEIRVCARESELAARGVFPYEELAIALRSVGLAPPLERDGEDPIRAGSEPALGPPPAAGTSWVPPRPSRYERLHAWARAHNRGLLLTGRVTMRGLRAMRRVASWR